MRDERILVRFSKRWTAAVNDLWRRVLHLGKPDRKRLALLLLLGLAIRLVGVFSLGDGGMGQFKDWTVLACSTGFTFAIHKLEWISLRCDS